MIRVVLAEDQAMVRGAFAALLALEDDIEVVAAAADGVEAMEAVELHRPDVLLTDVEMPRLGGIELAARVRQSFHTRVVIVTTFARAGYLRRALDAGVTGYVLKDSPIDQLATALRTVHAGGRVIDPELAVAVWGSADPLTDRERDVLRLVGNGLPNSQIADNLSLAEGTVRNYLSSAMLKLDARNRTEAFARARDAGYL
ncbi:MAG: response regulator transcription factor [Acidimicrobiia bacterium]